MNEKKEVCAYVRVSSHGQEEYSPAAQIRLINEYAQSNNMIIARVYQDLGISGRSADKRTEFINMIADCKDKSHPYEAILVWKFSRFARNQDESIVYKSLLKKENVDVISVSEPIPDGFAGGLIERILEWMDEYYSIRLSGEVKRGMTQKAMSGGYNGLVPIGYKKERGADTIPEIDDKYAPMVKTVFHLFACEGRSFAYIAKYINDLGYRTRRGNLWESRNISDMIQNPFYIGKIRWNNTNNRARKVSGETIIRDGQHPALIDNDTWEKANVKYSEITSKRNHGPRVAAPKHYLSGLIKCPHCGGSLAIQNGYDHKTGKYHPYFVCWKALKGMCDTRNSIGVAKAEQAVNDGLSCIIENKKIEKLAPIPQSPDVQAEQLQTSIKCLNKRIDRLRDSYLAGVDSLEEYKKGRQDLQDEIDTLSKKLTDIKKPIQSPITLRHIENVYEFLLSSDNNIDKAEAIRSVVDHIVYDKETDTMEFFLLGE